MLTTVGGGHKMSTVEYLPFFFSPALPPTVFFFHTGACVAHYCRSETRITRFCNNFITHMVNGALYALVREGIDFPH